MTFTKNSALVKNVWVPLVLAGIYSLDKVPALGNLKEIVESVIGEII